MNILNRVPTVLLVMSLLISIARAQPEQLKFDGAWLWETESSKEMLRLTKSGSKISGVVETEDGAVSLLIEGTLSADGKLTGSVFYAHRRAPDLPDPVWSKVLGKLGDREHPGMARASLALTYDKAKDEFRGTRGIFNVNYNRTSLVVNDVSEVQTGLRLTRLHNLPDVEIVSLKCNLHPSTTGGKTQFFWQVSAVVKNNGPADISDKFDLTLETALGEPNLEKTPKFSHPQGGICLPLKAGQSTTIIWDEERPNGNAERLFVAFNDVSIRVEANAKRTFQETRRDNNRRTLMRVTCSESKVNEDISKPLLFWVEVPDSETMRPTKPDYSLLFNSDAAKKAPELVVLCYIKMESKRRAKENQTKGSIAGSKFLNVLSKNFLTDYFKNPSPESGAAAMKKIGECQGAPRLSLKFGAALYVPEGIREGRPDIPEWIYPATEFCVTRGGLSDGKNHALLPLIDGPFLVGDENTTATFDNDATSGGKNWSQPMHWATGVAYGALSQDVLEDLYIGYEFYHLEGWDVFGEDSINDLIAEDQGTMLGKRLSTGSITSESDLIGKCDEDFRHARAWVGAMLALKQEKFDDLILQENSPKGNLWLGWDKRGNSPTANLNASDPKTFAPWGQTTVKGLAKSGKTAGQICKTSALVEHLIQIYTLIYEAEEWGRTHGVIRLGETQRNAVLGKYDSQFKAAPKDWGNKWEWKR